MRINIKPAVFLLLAISVGSVAGQETAVDKTQGSRLVPPSVFPSIPLDMRNIALAQTGKDGKTLRMIVPQFSVTTKTRRVNVSKFKLVTKTRTVVIDGEKVNQSYSVKVPYTEIATQSFSALEVASKGRFRVPIEQVNAWQLDGTRIEADELSKRAAKPLHFFVTRHPFDGLPPYFRESLNPETIVILIDADFLKKFPEKKKANEQTLKNTKD